MTHQQGSPTPFFDRQLPALPLQSPTNADLVEIARWASARAAALLDPAADEPQPVHELIRQIDTHSERLDVQKVATRAQLSVPALNRLRSAFRLGGADGLDNAHRPNAASEETLAEAVSAIRDAPTTRAFEPVVRDNSVTFQAAGVQIRLAPNGLWFPYTFSNGQWMPAPGHDLNPVTAYANAVEAARRRQP